MLPKEKTVVLRAKLDNHVSINPTDPEAEALAVVANALHMTKSEVIRQALALYVAEVRRAAQ